jgi:hypothetical protein
MLAALRTRAFRTLLAARHMTSTWCLLTASETLTLHRSIRKSGAHEVAEASETTAYHPTSRPSPTGALAVAAAAYC